MTPQAQNALLKVLEEPPTDIVILLLTDSPDALLTTIRSRTQSIRMHLLSAQQMEEALANHIAAQSLKRKDPDGYAALLESAAGRLGYILPRLEEKSRGALQKERAEAEAVVEALLVLPYADRIAVQNPLPSKRPELIALLERVMTALRDLLLLLKDEDAPLLFYIDKQSAVKLAEKAGTRRILAVYDCVCEAKESLSYNANIGLTTLSLFTEIDTRNKKSPK
jgi:DNA polymerase-3 subunit delta'